jgi:HEAT repeats
MAMIRIVRACAVAGSLVLAVSSGRAAPPKPGARSTPGLESADPAVRRDAIARLVANHDATAVAQLALALEGDDDETVRPAAASGLGDLGDKRGVAALKRCLKAEQSQVVKRSCRVSLGRLDPDAATMEPEAPAAGTPPPLLTPSPAPAAGPATPAATAGTATPSQALDLRIDVTPADAAERPNHVYVELWSAIDKNTLAIGFERVLDSHWAFALEPEFYAQSASAGGAKASAVSVALAVRPNYYFLQHAPSGPYISPFALVGYQRVTLEFPPEFMEPNEKISGTVWSVGVGAGWSLVINARAVLKLTAQFSYSKVAASANTSGLEASSSSATFTPFASAGVMF